MDCDHYTKDRILRRIPVTPFGTKCAEIQFCPANPPFCSVSVRDTAFSVANFTNLSSRIALTTIVRISDRSNVTSRSSKPALICRLAAITAILVSGTGKAFHLHQECGGRCGHAACRVETKRAVFCPYGCESCTLTNDHKDPSNSQVPQPTHTEHECAVCSVLAQAPEMPVVVGTLDFLTFVRISPERNWASPLTGAPVAVHSRGPPAVDARPAV